MQDSTFAIFIAFACIWILMGAAALIALLKSSGQELRFDKWGLVVVIPIILPLIIALIYQAIRPFVIQHFL